MAWDVKEIGKNIYNTVYVQSNLITSFCLSFIIISSFNRTSSIHTSTRITLIQRMLDA